MATSLTLRSVKGTQLTIAEVDANFTALRTTADGAVTDASAAQTTANNAGSAAAAAQTTANSASTAAAAAQSTANSAASAASAAQTTANNAATAAAASPLLTPGLVGSFAIGTSAVAIQTVGTNYTGSALGLSAGTWKLLGYVTAYNYGSQWQNGPVGSWPYYINFAQRVA